MQNLIITIILLPLLSAVLVLLFHKHENVRDALTTIITIVLFATGLKMYGQFDIEQTYRFALLEPIPNLEIAFHLEPLGLLFIFIASSLWLLTNIYAIGYMRGNNEKNRARFFFYFSLAISAVMAIAVSANLLTLFLFYELLTLITYPLVTHTGTDNAKQQGRIYLGVLLTTSIGLLLVGIISIWNAVGTVEFQPGGVITNVFTPVQIFTLYLLFLFGVGKAALMPFHSWLPAAMVAPTPVSALLHAVAVVKAGVFTICKVSLYIFGFDELSAMWQAEYIALIPGFTVVMASCIALQQDNLKKRLAFSTISQLSYVVMAVCVFGPLSYLAAGLHILAHAFGKIVLFFSAGAIYTKTKKTLVSQLDGIGYYMPFTMTAFAIGSLSMIGIPPTIGFISKWYMLHDATNANNWMVVAVLIISTILNAAYFFPIVYRAFFRSPESKHETYKQIPLLVAPIIIVMVIIVLLFFAASYPQTLLLLIGEYS